MQASSVPEWKVFTVGGQAVLHVPRGRGEDLRRHLASHGVTSVVSTAAEAEYERVEVESDADAESLQALVDQWAV